MQESVRPHPLPKWLPADALEEVEGSVDTKVSKLAECHLSRKAGSAVIAEGTDPDVTPRGTRGSPDPRAQAPQPHSFRLPGRGL